MSFYRVEEKLGWLLFEKVKSYSGLGYIVGAYTKRYSGRIALFSGLYSG